MTESVDQKAGRYLAEGRVAVLHVSPMKGRFEVLGSDDEPYHVGYGGDWTCNCQARVLECAHIVACQKITNFRRVQTSKLSSGDEITRLLAEL